MRSASSPAFASYAEGDVDRTHDLASNPVGASFFCRLGCGRGRWGISHGGWDDIFVVALLLGLINLYIRPFLTFISLPLTLLTLGFFLLVLNAAFLGLAPWIAGWVNVQFHVEDFWAALFGAILISIVSMIVGLFIKPDRIARELTGG